MLCVPRLISSVREMDCLREEIVSVSDRSSAQSSEHRPDGNSSKRECAGCIQLLESGEGCTNDSLSCPDFPP